jgi:hypothetical protein
VAREPEERAALTDVLHALTTEIAALLEPRDGRTPMPGDATWG